MGTETGVPERPVGRGPEAELELSDLALDSSLCSPGPGPKPQLWLLLGKTGQRRPPSRVRVTIKRNTECQVPGKVLGTRRTHKLSCRLCFTHSGEPSPSKPLKAGRHLRSAFPVPLPRFLNPGVSLCKPVWGFGASLSAPWMALSVAGHPVRRFCAPHSPSSWKPRLSLPTQTRRTWTAVGAELPDGAR